MSSNEYKQPELNENERKVQIQQSGRYLKGFNVDHELLQNKRRSVFTTLLEYARIAEKVMPVTVEDILYQVELPLRVKDNENSTEEINPFDWTGPARVEQQTFLDFIKQSDQASSFTAILNSTKSIDTNDFVNNITERFLKNVLEKGSFHGKDKTCPIIYMPNIFKVYFEAFLRDYIYMKQEIVRNNIGAPVDKLQYRDPTPAVAYALNLLRD